MESLSNSRAVGAFDLLSPPLTPIGTIDAQKLLGIVKESVRSGSRHIVLDCSGISCLYSDTLNVLGQMGKALKNHSGSLGVLSAHPSISKAIAAPALQDLLVRFSAEPEMLQASVHLMSEGATVEPEEKMRSQDSEESVEVVPEEIASFQEVEQSASSPSLSEVIATPAEEPKREEFPTREISFANEGIGSAFLQEDSSDQTSGVPLVEELLVENGGELSKELAAEDESLIVVASRRRWPKVVVLLLLIAASAAAALLFGIF